MKNIFKETAKYLLIFLALAVTGFMVVIVGLLVMILSPLLPLFQKDNLMDLWRFKEDV